MKQATLHAAMFLMALEVISGCSASGDRSGARTTATTSPLVGLDIGSPCRPEDGWMPSSPEEKSGLTPNEDPGSLDYPNLPPGTPYCLTRGSYPNGYFTMNCADDTECPEGSVCDDGLKCRAACESDAECDAPSTCIAHGKPAIRFCECQDCVLGGP